MTPSGDAYDETDTTLQFDPARWTDHAACAGTKTSLFFPERGDTTAHAKLICAGCPVREPCLQHAVDNNIRFGVWGGLSPRDRAPRGGLPQLTLVPRYRTEQPERRQPIRHGTVSGYRTHRRRGEQPCPDCRQAKANSMADYRAKEATT